jgi:hypothetical protein
MRTKETKFGGAHTRLVLLCYFFGFWPAENLSASSPASDFFFFLH